MTPQEKAEELFAKFEPYSIDNTPDYEKYNSAKFAFQMAKYSRKQCALIAVDEILNSRPAITDSQVEYNKYWQEVKLEIQNL